MRILLMLFIPFSYPLVSAEAARITPGTGLYVFQNTESISATDLTIRRVGDDGPAVNVIFTRGTDFPNLGLNTSKSIQFTGPPGIGPGAFTGFNFTGWRDIEFDVFFSYNNDPLDLRDPGRAFEQIKTSTDTVGPFELVTQYVIGPGPFSDPPTDIDFRLGAGGITAVSTPSTTFLFGIGTVILTLIIGGRARL